LVSHAFTKVWTESPQEVKTSLSVAEAELRLSRGRYEDGAMEILIQRRGKDGGYSIIALRRYWSNGLQRFFVCNLEERAEGASLTGVIRARGRARRFLNFGLGFLSLVFAISLMATLVKLGQGEAGQALTSAGYLLLVLIFAAGLLGFVHVSMMITARNERYLIGWLAKRLS
jgi:hypothetical protein